MEHLSPSELVNLGWGAIGSMVAGVILMLRARQSLPALAKELARLLGPVLREVLEEEVREMVVDEMKPLLNRVATLEDDADAMKRRVGMAAPVQVAP